MDKASTALRKSKAFAVRIVRLYQYLCSEKKEFVLSRQLLRSGTSIGANLAENECAISKKDFLAKIYIALKECAETLYWMELLFSCHHFAESEYESLKTDCIELQKLLISITKSTKNTL